jgi:ABC-2 type transport system ATP-binding protein
MIRVEGLQKRYGDTRAVDGISFSIESGEVFGLLGPNGAGKSTTINIIANLLAPDGGVVELAGGVRVNDPAYKRRIGYVPQEISLAEKLTARENLNYVGRLYDLHGGDLARRTQEKLEAVGLTDRADDLVSTFSGGMKRRLNIAAALLHDPDLILMDEPTAGVDPQARAYIFEIVEGLAARGRSVLYTTHYMEEAQRLCRRTAIVDHGKILAQGTLPELTQNLDIKRDLLLEAQNLNSDLVQQLSRKLGDVAWSFDNHTARLAIRTENHALIAAVRGAEELGIHLSMVSLNEPTLETVFLKLTGRALRD